MEKKICLKHSLRISLEPTTEQAGCMKTMTVGRCSGKKKKLVALKANSFAGQNTLDQMQETEEQLMDCGPGSRITTTPSPGSLGDAFSLALTFLLPLTMTTEETSGAPYLSNDALVCHQWS